MNPSPIMWRRKDVPGLEWSRITAAYDEWDMDGTVLLMAEGLACRLNYTIRCDANWRTLHLTVDGHVGERFVCLLIERWPEGEWRLDSVPQPAVSGCDDIDLHFSPSTNLLPIRRLDLAVGSSAQVRAAWLRFPDMTLHPLDQTYTRREPNVYRYQAGSFIADIVVDDEGRVVDYAEWSRVR